MPSWMKWWYHDADGVPVFQHYRISDPDDPRGKRYGYRYPEATSGRLVTKWCWAKPEIADSLIYRLPDVLANPDVRLVLCEGERDSHVLLDRNKLASCHHGGAGKFTEAMAESLAGHRGPIVLVADNDAAGAYDVCRRYDLLRAVGIPAKRLSVREVVPTHRGADLRDHYDAGFRFRDLVPGDLDRLRASAAQVSSMSSEGRRREGSWPYDGAPWGRNPDGSPRERWTPTVVRRR